MSPLLKVVKTHLSRSSRALANVTEDVTLLAPLSSFEAESKDETPLTGGRDKLWNESKVRMLHLL